MKNNKILKGLLAVTIAMYPLTTFAATKKETVFTNLNPNGSVVDTTVTNYVCAITKEQYEDDTRLSEIVNLNGNETFTQDGTKITWKANGNDIYYQGNTNEEQPINVSIKYYLDGQEMNAEDIKGKSGKVTIKINMENKMKNRVKVNGKYETLYTPFVVMAGTIINSEDNKDITATNGRVVNTGNKNIVASIASPGLYESMNMSKLSNLDEIEFSFKTTNFKMDNIYIIATPKLLEEKDVKLFKDLDKVTDSIKLLQDSMNKIEKGSSDLKSGTDSLSAGVDKIAKALPSEKDNKANEEKLTYLKGQNEDTVKKLTAANKELETQKKTVEGKMTALYTELTKANNAYESNKADLDLLSAAPSLTQEQAVQKQTLEKVVPLLKNQYEALKETYGLLDQTKASLETSIEANKGLIKLISGNNEVVKSSINTIDSMRTLSGAINQLEGGIKKLNTGATTLNQGITKFNKEGINKLSSYSNKVNNYSSKAEALVNLSKNYKGFASDNSNETIFVNKVQSIK